MGIEHWLIYGSIFGARRIQGPLPWDNDADIAFDGNGRFAEITFDEFFARFRAADFSLRNKWIKTGSFVVSCDGLPLTVDLFAYYDHGGLMKRTGLESWLFAINHPIYHAFPTRLVKSPLPKTQFPCEMKLGIPRNFFLRIPRNS